jgi:hypothetical protein
LIVLNSRTPRENIPAKRTPTAVSNLSLPRRDTNPIASAVTTAAIAPPMYSGSPRR